MTLSFETNYRNKQDQLVNLKYPKMKVMGKSMDENETHTFEMLGDQINVYDQGLYPNYKLFVKYPDQEAAFNLDLSRQAYLTINALNPQKWDKITIWKGMKENTKSGAMMPIILASIEKNQSTQTQPVQATQPTQQQPIVTQTTPVRIPKQDHTVDMEFIKKYKASVPLDKVSTNHFVGTYLRTKTPEQVFHLVQAYHDYVDPNQQKQ